MDQALSHTEEATKFDPEMDEALFQTSKILMAKDEPEKAIGFLRRVVDEDSDYLFKAAGDGDFQNHGDELLELVNELRQKSKAGAEKAIAYAQSLVNEMEEWNTSEGAASQTKSALAPLAQAHQCFQVGSLFSYQYAQGFVELMEEKANEALEAQKDNMLKTTDTLFDKVVKMQGDCKKAISHESHQSIPLAFNQVQSAFRELGGEKMDIFR